MENKTICILLLMVWVGLMVFIIIQMDELQKFQEKIIPSENLVSENILSQTYPNITGKEKVEIIKQSCKKEFPEEITHGSWIFKQSYSSRNCETNFINKIVIDV